MQLSVFLKASDVHQPLRTTCAVELKQGERWRVQCSHYWTAVASDWGSSTNSARTVMHIGSICWQRLTCPHLWLPLPWGALALRLGWQVVRLFCFFFACLWGFFDHKHLGSLVPWSEIKPSPPASGARTLNRWTKQGTPRSRGEIEHSKFKGCLLPWIFISWTCPSGQPPLVKAQSLPKMREKEVIVGFLPHLLALKLFFFPSQPAGFN